MSTARASLGTARLQRPDPAERRDPRPLVALALVLAGSIVALLIAGRDTTFFFDDWDFVQQRRAWNFHVFLFPHNEHFSAVPVLVYKAMFETIGLGSYVPYRVLVAGLNALVGLLLFAYAAPRAGRWPAVGVVAAVVFMGPAWRDLLWAFQIGYLISLAAGLLALLAFDRRGRAWDALACACLLVALASSGLGIALLAAAIVEVLWREDRVRRLWIVGVPLVLYAAWYLRYGKSAAKGENVADVPRWIADMASGAAGAVSGLGTAYGPILVVILAFLVGRSLVRAPQPSGRLVALLALPLAFWAATALARADTGIPPDESRYLYPGGLFVALIVVELLRDRPLRGRVAAYAVAALAFAAAANLAPLERGGDELRGHSESVLASITALEWLGPQRVPAGVQPDPVQPQVRAGSYFAAIADYGSSPSLSEVEVRRGPGSRRAKVDAALVRLGGIGVATGGAPAPREQPPAVVAKTAATEDSGSCQRVTPSGPGDTAVLVPRDGEIAVLAGRKKVEVRVLRYGDEVPAAAIGEVAAGATSTVEVTPDAAATPWRIALRSSAPFRGCGAAD